MSSAVASRLVADPPDLGFTAFDADNHYYEATDAFTRYIPRPIAKRCMQWADIDGRRKFLVGGRVNSFIPNPTFDPVARPGSLDLYFRGKVSGNDIRAMFGELDAIHPEYRDRDARLALMDRQGIEAAFFFPTLGVGMEESLRDDVEAALAAFRAFNRWLDDDWGFAYRDRIYAAPYLTLSDPAWATEELEHALDRGARVIVMRCAPVQLPGGAYRSPGDPINDGFWARCAEAQVVVAFHSGDSGYQGTLDRYEPSGAFRSFEFSPLHMMIGDRAQFDFFASLTTHGVLARHPGLKLASIEAGSAWVPALFSKLKKVYSQNPMAFAGDPIEQLRQALWVAPFYEDDIRGLADLIGVDRVLFGSDYPHAEGLAEPLRFIDDLHGFNPDEVQMIMRDNARTLLG